MDVKTRDDDLQYPEDGAVSNGCRNMAILSDIVELYSSDALFMLPSWEGIPEAQAMYAVAKAMKKPVIDFPHTAFMET